MLPGDQIGDEGHEGHRPARGEPVAASLRPLGDHDGRTDLQGAPGMREGVNLADQGHAGRPDRRGEGGGI